MSNGTLRPRIGIDLGTASCLVYRGNQIVLNEPSVVALDIDTDEIIAIGTQAWRMIGRTNDRIRTVRPLREGVISQYRVTLRMLEFFIRQATKNRLLKPVVVVCIPSGITEVEERAVVDAAKNAGAHSVYLIEEPVAAAIGAGIDISKPEGNMVVDIGGGTTDIAVIALDGVVVSESIKVAGDKFDESIMKYVRSRYNLLIGERTAEEIKKTIGNVYRHSKVVEMTVGGRCLAQGIPREITLTSREMLEAMLNPIQAILDAICQVIERTPPELVQDITKNGIKLTGGGALLKGLDRLIADFVEIKAEVAANPINCVAIGTGKSLDHSSLLYSGSVNLTRNGQRDY